MENAKNPNPVKLDKKSFNKVDEFFIDFLPLVISEKMATETVSNKDYRDFEILFALDASFASEAIPQTTITQTTKTLEAIDWSAISGQNIAESQQDENSNVTDYLKFSKNTYSSYSPDFPKEQEMETMVLLENIADLGDCRELPILHKLQKESSSRLVLERVHELIQKFSFQSPGPKELFHSHNTQKKSVFTAIFNQSDTETKLILLEDINKIGDEKEIPLLKMLLNDSNKFIAHKAVEVLKHIQLKKNREEIIEIAWYDKLLFNVDYELELEKKLTNNEGTTLFDQLCSMSPKLYNSLSTDS